MLPCIFSLSNICTEMNFILMNQPNWTSIHLQKDVVQSAFRLDLKELMLPKALQVIIELVREAAKKVPLQMAWPLRKKTWPLVEELFLRP